MAERGVPVALIRLRPGQSIMETIRVLIVDDHAVVRDGLSTMFGREQDFVVVG